MKYVVNWIPLRIRVRSRNTQPHLNTCVGNDYPSRLITVVSRILGDIRGVGGKPKIVAKRYPSVSNSAWKRIFQMNVDFRFTT